MYVILPILVFTRDRFKSYILSVSCVTLNDIWKTVCIKVGNSRQGKVIFLISLSVILAQKFPWNGCCLPWDLVLGCNHRKYTTLKTSFTHKVKNTVPYRVYPWIVIFCHFKSIQALVFPELCTLHIAFGDSGMCINFKTLTFMRIRGRSRFYHVEKQQNKVNKWSPYASFQRKINYCVNK